MHLDGREVAELERVVDRPRIVRPRSGVENQAVSAAAKQVQALDVGALGVGLEELGLQLERRRALGDPRLQLGERQRAVMVRVAQTEHVEVHAVQDCDSTGAHASSSLTAPRTSRRSTRTPYSTSPGSRTRTKGTP